MSSEDLLDHFKLNAEILPEYTIHVSHRLNRARGVQERVETKWKRMEDIGEGAFGQVWRELHHPPGGIQNVRAVKRIGKQRMKAYKIDVKRELLALAKLSKEEYRQAEVFVSFLGWFENDQAVFLAMEYIGNGDLAQHIPSISAEDEVRQISRHLLFGLRIMHDEGFTHRDLKPQNIFVVQKPPQSKRWWVKIGDFGISKRVVNEDTELRTSIGTRLFQAPEAQGFICYDDRDLTYNNSVDMWSLGCVIYNISAREVPFPRIQDISKFCQKNSPFPEQPLYPRLNKMGIDFIMRLLVPQPAERLSAKDALNDPWILYDLPTNLHGHTPIASEEGRKYELVEIAAPTAQIEDMDASQNFNVHSTNKPDQGSMKQPQHHYRPRIPMQTPQLEGNTINIPMPIPGPSARWSTLDEPIIQSRTSMLNEPDSANAEEIYALPNLTAENANAAPRESPDQPKHQPSEDASATSESEETTARLEQSSLLKTSDWSGSVNGTTRTILKGHSGWVWCVAFSPDGRSLASASLDHTVRLWDPATGTARATLEGHSAVVSCVAFSPDGRSLASASQDRTVRLWDPATGAARATLEGHSDWVRCVAFSPDGRSLASASGDRTVRLWDPATGTARATLEGHSAVVWCVAFSPDGRSLASASTDRTVRLWDPATGTARATLEGHSDWVWCVAFSPDGRSLASASGDRTVRLWDPATGTARATLEGHSDVVSCVAFSPDGRSLASASGDRTVRLWDPATGTARATLEGHSRGVWCVAFSPDGRSLASASQDRTVRLWDLATGATRATKRPSRIDRLRDFLVGR